VLFMIWILFLPSVLLMGTASNQSLSGYIPMIAANGNPFRKFRHLGEVQSREHSDMRDEQLDWYERKAEHDSIIALSRRRQPWGANLFIVMKQRSTILSNIVNILNSEPKRNVKMCFGKPKIPSKLICLRPAHDSKIRLIDVLLPFSLHCSARKLLTAIHLLPLINSPPGAREATRLSHATDTQHEKVTTPQPLKRLLKQNLTLPLIPKR